MWMDLEMWMDAEWCGRDWGWLGLGPQTSLHGMRTIRVCPSAKLPTTVTERAKAGMSYPICECPAAPVWVRRTRGPGPSSKATLWVKAQHEGALPPPCSVRPSGCEGKLGVALESLQGLVLLRGTSEALVA